MFDIIVGADTVKKVKPDPDVFRYALRKLNVKAEESLFVGDLVDADYRGAENVGMQGILLKRIESKDKSRHLRTITSLEEIFKHIYKKGEFCGGISPSGSVQVPVTPPQ